MFDWLKDLRKRIGAKKSPKAWRPPFFKPELLQLEDKICPSNLAPSAQDHPPQP